MSNNHQKSRRSEESLQHFAAAMETIDDNGTSSLSSSLRASAEARLAEEFSRSVPDYPAEQIIYELQVHKVELVLEMQVEALREAHAELTDSRDRYQNLFDFAPIGYLSLTDDGHIFEANHSATKLLGIVASQIAKLDFEEFVAVPDRDRWHQKVNAAKANGNQYSFNQILIRSDQTPIYAHLDCKYINSGRCLRTLRIALRDVSEQFATENHLRKLSFAVEQSSDSRRFGQGRRLCRRCQHY